MYQLEPPFSDDVREAAAAVLGAEEAEGIVVELEERWPSKDGRFSVILNWPTSMTCKDKWAAVEAAVRPVLPEEYRQHLIMIT